MQGYAHPGIFLQTVSCRMGREWKWAHIILVAGLHSDGGRCNIEQWGGGGGGGHFIHAHWKRICDGVMFFSYFLYFLLVARSLNDWLSPFN